jgi:hypothetical protein
MASLSSTVNLQSVDMTSSHAGANDVVRALAANPAFRAATAEELVNEHNPFRRPVRPDDLAWLDFSVPLVPAKVLMLSGLLGHRMLRNVYDADVLYVPDQPTRAAMSDGGHFYSAENRARGALAAPVLERHLFAMLAGERESLAGSGINCFGGMSGRVMKNLSMPPGVLLRSLGLLVTGATLLSFCWCSLPRSCPPRTPRSAVMRWVTMTWRCRECGCRSSMSTATGSSELRCTVGCLLKLG